MPEPGVQIVADAEQLAQRGAQEVVRLAREAIGARGVFRLCVSGGQTPRGVYTRLAQPEVAGLIDFRRVEIYFGDERCVPPGDAQSNFRMLRETLLAHAQIPKDQVHRIEGERAPDAAAQAYAERLRALLGAADSGEPAGAFDLVLLGLGADAHTASLFPGSPIEAAARVWTSARQQPATGSWRVTLTETALNASRHTLFLISGADKARPLAEVLRGPRDLLRLPAQRITPRGSLTFLIDQSAAAQL